MPAEPLVALEVARAVVVVEQAVSALNRVQAVLVVESYHLVLEQAPRLVPLREHHLDRLRLDHPQLVEDAEPAVGPVAPPVTRERTVKETLVAPPVVARKTSSECLARTCPPGESSFRRSRERPRPPEKRRRGLLPEKLELRQEKKREKQEQPKQAQLLKQQQLEPARSEAHPRSAPARENELLVRRARAR